MCAYVCICGIWMVRLRGWVEGGSAGTRSWILPGLGCIGAEAEGLVYANIVKFASVCRDCRVRPMCAHFGDVPPGVHQRSSTGLRSTRLSSTQNLMTPLRKPRRGTATSPCGYDPRRPTDAGNFNTLVLAFVLAQWSLLGEGQREAAGQFTSIPPGRT